MPATIARTSLAIQFSSKEPPTRRAPAPVVCRRITACVNLSTMSTSAKERAHADCSRVTGIHVSLCQQKSTRFLGALERARNRSDQVSTVTQWCLSACGSCFLAEPDIHLLSETPKSPHRRLSLCSLPVPKQTEGSLWSCLRRSARHLRDLAACAPDDPDVVSFPGRFLRCRGASKLLGGHEVLFSALHC